ncbi:MAG: permease [Cyanobacteria bacterium RYN_339]|nr:permease [Cyanobacteria bacterium RYN_339]
MTLQDYLDGYEAAHRHPGNQATHAIGIPMIVVSLFIAYWHPIWAAALFVVGWIFQFIGHHLEGNSPKFFQGPMYLLVGPLWVLIKLGRLLGLKRREA